MTGSDIEWWLEGIWYDLLHLSSADVPTLVFKLFLLFVASFFLWQLGRMAVKAVWSVVGPLLRLLWRIVTAPVRLPWRGLKRLYRPVAERRRERRFKQQEIAEAEWLQARERERERKEAEALAAARRIIDVGLKQPGRGRYPRRNRCEHRIVESRKCG